MHQPVISKFSKYPPKFLKYVRSAEPRRLSHGMQPIACEINESSPDFKENASNMKVLVNDLRRICAKNLITSNAKAITLHKSRQKMLVRDRIDKLLDNGSAFLEIAQLAGLGVYGSDELPAGGIVTGIGQIAGIECMIVANDGTVKGGTYYPITVQKHLRAQEIAEQNRLPCIYLVDSGGANLKYGDEVFSERKSFGRIFYNMANLSAKGIPQVAVVLGNCTAGGAYIPSMADESVIVKGTGSVFLAGPPLVKAALGEVVTAEELGGADVHCRQSGVTDHYAENEEHALHITRKIISRVRNEKKNVTFDHCEPKSPLFSSDYLYGVVEPKNNSFDMKKVIACLVDGSEMDEFKPLYGDSLVTGFARINGFLVGILGNNNVLFSESSLKAIHFIQLCCQRKVPLLFLHNVTGYMVGKDAEAEGIAKNGAKMVNAVSCAQVPKISVIIGNSYGAANFGMCGSNLNPRFIFAWPNARSAIMGSQQAADVLTSIGKISEDDKQKMKMRAMELFEERSKPYYASARLWNDGIIDPAETRKVLSLCLSVCLKEPVENRAEYGIFRT